MNNYQEIFESSVTGVLNYLHENKLRTMILGISGGIDSTVCAVICEEVLRQDPSLEFYGVFLPCSTNTDKEVETANKVGKAFFKPGYFWVRNLQTEFECLDKCFSEQVISTPLSQGNIKARLRMCYLRNLASLKKGLVIDTDNLSEHYLGFFTIAGDVGDLSPIANLWKHEVYSFAEWLTEFWRFNYIESKNNPDDDVEITDSCFQRYEALRDSKQLIPTDGNGVKAGGDLAQIAPSLSSYTEVDEILMAHLKYRGKPSEFNLYTINTLVDKYGEETVKQVISRVKTSEFKRKPSPVKIELKGIDREDPSRKEVMKRIIKKENAED